MCVLHPEAYSCVLARGVRQEATFPLFSAVSPLVACQQERIRVILPAATRKPCLHDKTEEVFS
jgi:hypothetical protein